MQAFIQQNPWLKALLLSLAGVLLLIPLFYGLGDHVIYIWDEAIYANNTIGMLESGDLIMLYKDGQINHYNSKPPLVIWLQSLSCLILGVNEFAIRLPSALAAVGVLLIIIWFSRRTFRRVDIGILACFILIMSQGYVRPHVTRSGDLDSVMIFFTTAYILYFLDCLLNRQSAVHWRNIWTMAFLVVCAFYTKSIAGVLPIAGLGILSVATKNGRLLYRQPQLYIAVAVGLGICAGYYVLKNAMWDGFAEHALGSDFTRFSGARLGWHEQPFFYYLNNFVARERFYPYIFVLPIALFWVLVQKRTDKLTQAAGYLLVVSLAFLLILSFSRVKLNYYAAPVLPLLSLIVSVTLINGYQKLRHHKVLSTIYSIGIVCVLAWNYYELLKFNNNIGLEPQEEPGVCINAYQDMFEHHDRAIDFLMEIPHNAHKDQALFYTWMARKEGIPIIFHESHDQLNAELLLTSQPGQLTKLQSMGYRVIQKDAQCLLMMKDIK